MPAPGPLWAGFIEECTIERAHRFGAASEALRILGGIEVEFHRMSDPIDELICPRCDLPMDGARCRPVEPSGTSCRKSFVTLTAGEVVAAGSCFGSGLTERASSARQA
jgi:hypothetical protein